jgi:putative RNA 2'-phosphotransferase
VLLFKTASHGNQADNHSMDDKRKKKISKYLSRHLRHEPERLGITLQAGGWVTVDDLIAACARHNMILTRAELDEVVATNDKQRFAFDDTRTLIRANQGHSVEIDLQLDPADPPDVLYHGTGSGSVGAIFESGLKKMSRHHVHLSADLETARKVGSRHGKPAIFVVDAAAMQHDDYMFYRSDNGVWLINHVPAQYLRLID